MGHSIASIGGIIFIYDFKKEICNADTDSSLIEMLSILCTCIMLAALLQTITLRFVNIYRDAPLNRLTVRLENGPAAGLYTTAEHASMYTTVCKVLQDHCQSDDLNPEKNNNGSLFITKLLPFGYLCSDLKCGSPTTWRTSFNSVRLEDYYQLNPDRYPDLILVLDEEYGSYSLSPVNAQRSFFPRWGRNPLANFHKSIMTTRFRTHTSANSTIPVTTLIHSVAQNVANAAYPI